MKNMQKWSLKKRVYFTALTPAVSIFLFSVVGLSVSTYFMFKTNLVLTKDSIITMVERDGKYAIFSGKTDDFAANLKQAHASNKYISVKLYDRDGSVLFENKNNTLYKFANVTYESTFFRANRGQELSELVLGSNVNDNPENHIGKVEIVLNYITTNERFIWLALLTLGFMLLGAIVAIPLVVISKNSLVTPLTFFSRVVNAIANRKWDEINIDRRSGGEIGKLEDNLIVCKEHLQNFERQVNIALEQYDSALKKSVESEKKAKESDKKTQLANESQSRFLSVMNHEIRSPISNILNILQMSNRPHNQDDLKQLQYKKQIEDQARDLLSLIEGILNYTKAAKQGFPIKEEIFETSTLLEDMVDGFKLSANNNDISFSYNFTGSNWDSCGERAVGDISRIRLITRNLIDNAIKYTPVGGKITLDVRVQPLSVDHSILEISVTDTGRGIAPEDLKTIFDPFKQVSGVKGNEKNTYMGVGLGLSFCQELASAVDAKIDVRSIEGKGSTFTLRMQLQNAIQEDTIKEFSESSQAETLTTYDITSNVESLVPANDSVPEEKEIHQFRILYVEDQEIKREYLADLFEHIDQYALDLAENGIQALEMVKACEYDLCFMDINMQPIDGLETTRQMRTWQKKTGSHMFPIIALSEIDMPLMQPKALEAGMNDYIQKGENDIQYLLKVHEWLHKPDELDSLKNISQNDL